MNRFVTARHRKGRPLFGSLWRWSATGECYAKLRFKNVRESPIFSQLSICVYSLFSLVVRSLYPQVEILLYPLTRYQNAADILTSSSVFDILSLKTPQNNCHIKLHRDTRSLPHADLIRSFSTSRNPCESTMSAKFWTTSEVLRYLMRRTASKSPAKPHQTWWSPSSSRWSPKKNHMHSGS